jgi:hypothetical protein
MNRRLRRCRGHHTDLKGFSMAIPVIAIVVDIVAVLVIDCVSGCKRRTRIDFVAKRGPE